MAAREIDGRGEQQPMPLHGAAIEDYALIGDCETAALVSREGSIDWLCWPSFSSSAVFAALLGTCDHGFWKISPAERATKNWRQYRKDTMIVETHHRTDEGEVCVVDFMPIRNRTGGRHSQVVRIVQGVSGSVRMRMELSVRFDYGRTVPWVTSGDGTWRAVAGSDMVVLETEATLEGKDHSTASEFTVGEGETMPFVLTYASSLEKAPAGAAPEQALARTESFWTKWAGRNKYRGEYAEAVSRSLMTLKALTYRPTGGIVAAVTTSLPEEFGGERNWDYRYCWLRDTSFTLLGMLRAGYREEAMAWRRWLLRAAAGAPDQLQTMYGIGGERDLIEWEAAWLPGYRNSRPVRIGNKAVEQFQLDVFGETASALARIPDAEDDIRVSARDLLRSLINHLCTVWRRPDQGIWEVRGGAKHFTHSKVMAWVAFDRAIQFMECVSRDESDAAVQDALDRDVERWKQERETVHREVCEKGFDAGLNSFTQSYGSRTLDASCLRIALVGFLPPDDPRIVGTVNAIEQGLMKDGFVQRYKTEQTEDGLKGSEGQFLACSFWMATDLWLIGRKHDARAMFARLLALRNDVGLLSEEYDSDRKCLAGNFPQALSHIALIHAAFTIAGEWEPQRSGNGTTKSHEARS